MHRRHGWGGGDKFDTGRHLAGMCSASTHTWACLSVYGASTTPPPLCKHQESQESDGQTGSWCLDKAVLASNAQYQKNACPKNLPIPHSRHNRHNRALKHNV